MVHRELMLRLGEETYGDGQYTLWYCNIPIENDTFIVDLPS